MPCHVARAGWYVLLAIYRLCIALRGVKCRAGARLAIPRFATVLTQSCQKHMLVPEAAFADCLPSSACLVAVVRNSGLACSAFCCCVAEDFYSPSSWLIIDNAPPARAEFYGGRHTVVLPAVDHPAGRDSLHKFLKGRWGHPKETESV